MTSFIFNFTAIEKNPDSAPILGFFFRFAQRDLRRGRLPTRPSPVSSDEPRIEPLELLEATEEAVAGGCTCMKISAYTLIQRFCRKSDQRSTFSPKLRYNYVITD